MERKPPVAQQMVCARFPLMQNALANATSMALTGFYVPLRPKPHVQVNARCYRELWRRFRRLVALVTQSQATRFFFNAPLSRFK